MRAIPLQILIMTGAIHLVSLPAFAQIGGKKAEDGPFLLENAEDLDGIALGVQRAWIPDIYPITAISLGNSGLTLASEQSEIGCLDYSASTQHGYISNSFGVPLPATPGASTATHPGNISDFANLTFFARVSNSYNNQKLQVLLECYPETSPGSNVFPTLYWNYTLAPGTAFQQVVIDLHAPSYVANAGSLSVNDLLSKTRYLAFYFYAGPETGKKTLRVDVDDIRLSGTIPVRLSEFSIE